MSLYRALPARERLSFPQLFCKKQVPHYVRDDSCRPFQRLPRVKTFLTEAGNILGRHRELFVGEGDDRIVA